MQRDRVACVVMSGLFQEVMHELGIRQKIPLVDQHQSQKAIERYHQTSKAIIQTHCINNPEDLVSALPFLFTVRVWSMTQQRLVLTSQPQNGLVEWTAYQLARENHVDSRKMKAYSDKKEIA